MFKRTRLAPWVVQGFFDKNQNIWLQCIIFAKQVSWVPVSVLAPAQLCGQVWRGAAAGTLPLLTNFDQNT